MKDNKAKIGGVGIFALFLEALGAFLTVYGLFSSFGLFIVGAPIFVLGLVVYYADLSSRKRHERRVQAAIEQQQKAAASTSSATLTSMDELKKLKELLDVGAITKEEFEKKKKSIMEKL